MYVGDEGLIDIVAKESDQARTGKMSRLMGAELSAKKRHLMASIGEVSVQGLSALEMEGELFKNKNALISS